MSLVYHYCSLETFDAIISSQIIRLSEITKSNDSQEIDHTLSQASIIFKKMIAEVPQVEEWYVPIIAAPLDMHFTSYHSIKRYAAACFSYAEDNLSQWRGYADNGKGISLGFDKELLLNEYKNFVSDLGTANDIYSEMDFSLLYGDVFYSDNQCQEVIKKLILPYIEYIKECDISKFLEEVFSDVANLSKNDLHNNKLLADICSGIYAKAPFFKHKSFQEEHEWRIVLPFLNYAKPIASDTISNTAIKKCYEYQKYYLHNDRLITYFDFIFSPSIIKKIYIGPRCQLGINDIYYMLMKNDYDTRQITVEKTNSPFR